MTYKTQLKDQVEKVLQDTPETRNSDIALTIEVWKRYYSAFVGQTKSGDDAIKLISLYQLPTQDNIKRIRAKFQNDELKYLPTKKEVAKQRRINEEVWRAQMSTPMLPKEIRKDDACASIQRY